MMARTVGCLATFYIGINGEHRGESSRRVVDLRQSVPDLAHIPCEPLPSRNRHSVHLFAYPVLRGAILRERIRMRP